MIHEHELLGIVAKLNLRTHMGRNSTPCLGCCIRVYDMNNEDENIIRDDCFVCDFPFDSLSITINGETHKDWLEQMVKNEWITGFPDGYTDKTVKIKYHYDEKSVERKDISIPIKVTEDENDHDLIDTTEKHVSYETAELIVSEIDFLDYKGGFTLKSNSTKRNTYAHFVDIFKFATPYEVTFENLQDYPNKYISTSHVGDLLATKNELEQVLGTHVGFKVDKSKYYWIVKMTAKRMLTDNDSSEKPYTESYLFTVYDYSKNHELDEDEMYRYSIGGCRMLEGDENNPMIIGNDVYRQLPLKLFKAKLMNKILDIRNNVSKE